MKKITVLLFSLCALEFGTSQVPQNQLCIDNLNSDACQQISRMGSMKCHFVITKTDCILGADLDSPLLSILSPEEAFLGAGLVSSNAVVIGEIVEEDPPYQTAVIVKSGYSGGFEAQRGLKFCHPGYKHDRRVSKFVLEELDRKVIRYSCNSSKTLVEQKFEALSLTYGSSCRPGNWSEDEDLDARLKSEYPSLCALCGPKGCGTKYIAPLNDSLTCLTDNAADVALTALHYAQAFFSNEAHALSYQYLCPNGSVAPSTSPCTWTNQLRRLILTSRSSAHLMTEYVQTNLPSFVNPEGTGKSSEHLALLLGVGYTDKITLFAPVPLRDYVSKIRTIPQVNESIQCGLTLNWSVTHQSELNKCLWLQQASLNSGLQPVISCVASQYNDTVSNLDNIRDGKADLAFIDANFGYIAKQKNLVNVAYPETDAAQLNKIVIVVKNDSTWYSDLTSLRGKQICLPEYGGKEWLAFIDLLRSKNAVNNSCDYGKLFSDFVGDSCAPGANSKELDIPDTDTTKLCANCIPVDQTLTAKYCNANGNNAYYDSIGSLRCLERGNGDYAVIALNDLPRQYWRTGAENQFRVVSKNGTLASYNGFQVDEGAAISIVVAGEVVAKNGTAKYHDIVLYLQDVEADFGLSLQKPFKVFDEFNGTKNLLFPDSTLGLTFGGSPNKYINNYINLRNNSDNCARNDDGSDNDGNSTTGGTAKISAPCLLFVVILTGWLLSL